MLMMVLASFGAGLLIGVSRQVNGRLGLATTPLLSSSWNHWVGFGALTVVGLALGGLTPGTLGSVPPLAWIGGPLGVLFVASGSYFVARLGAARTAMLVIAGQMVSGVGLDLIRGVPGTLWMTAAGVAMILAGMMLMQRRD
jgi:bacterial/archaeal transporter family-2 protein